MSETQGTIPGNDGSLNEQVYTLVGFWLGSLIYGIYVVLFIAAIQVSLRNKRNGLAFSWVLFLSMISMFIMITTWTFISLYRGIQAFALGAAGPMPVVYYHNPAQWGNFSFPLIATLLTWHGDLLVIYRCFVIWGHNFWVILVPVLLFLASVGINTVLLAWFQHPTLIPQTSAFTLLDLVYPLNLLQNVLTTGLIAFRIYTSHRRSRAAGLMHAGVGGLSMLMVVRIVVESALIFTVQQLLLMVLQLTKSPGQVVLHATTIPSIGIVFVLMALRTHFAQTTSEIGKTGGGKFSSSHRISTRNPHSGSISVVTTRVTVKDSDDSSIIPMQTFQHQSYAKKSNMSRSRAGGDGGDFIRGYEVSGSSTDSKVDPERLLKNASPHPGRIHAPHVTKDGDL